MSTLAKSDARNTCCTRLARLTPDASRRWGRMTAHQMVCHLNDSFAVGAGTRYASPAKNILTTTVVKWIALRTPLRWPPGFRTRPEIDQNVGGTPPGDWDGDCAELRGWIMEFAAGGASEKSRNLGIHPIFGPMSARDWLTWGYRHVDHHFRQFGI
jgi:hypothetical protein